MVTIHVYTWALNKDRQVQRRFLKNLRNFQLVQQLLANQWNISTERQHLMEMRWGTLLRRAAG